MDLDKLDHTWNNIENYSDLELQKLYNHSLEMQHKFQESGDNLALEYWADLAQMILCQQEKRRLIHV